jgi:3-oxoacyl-[acyl-carrier-protein] synthase II
MKRRVVITGLGFCSPLGCQVDEVWHGLLAGRSGIGPITLFDARAFPVRIGGEVKAFEAGRVLERFPEVAGEQDRKVWLGLDAAARAVADAGLVAGALEAASLHVGVSLETLPVENVLRGGSAGDGFASLLATFLADGGRLQTPLDRTAHLLGHHYGMRGGLQTNCSACAAGAQVIGEAFRRLRGGLEEVALAGATDSALNPLGLGGFALLRILSEENDQPERACRPFEVTRQGTVLSEGAAFVVLETLEHAARRGARVYAEVLGYGSSLDAYRVTDPEPSGRGALLSMTKALADARLGGPDVDGINAHGTGTPKNDMMETRAIQALLGERAWHIPVHAVKSMTGHMIATSGAFEAAVAALTLHHGKVPPTRNLARPDPACDLDYVAEGSRDFSGRTVLSNSFGFGGQNATLVLGRP